MSWLDSPITTEHLAARPMASGDEKAIAALFLDAEGRRYLGGALSKREARRRACVVSAGATDRYWGYFSVVERSTDTVIGMVGFDRERGPWQLNYEIRREWWGRGLALEACIAILAWFWQERPEEHELIAVTQAANVRSCRLLDRLNARLVREFVQFDALQREYTLSRGSDDRSDATA
jgi:RimJ/RimL family protein N-acetyltransferase